ncbi:MAG: DUF4982 domain-containing protein, partial [Pontiellaceae bacterium]|nr:DUF4982 domain-containing protein [Pontiellaceae bacterium]
MKLWTDKWIFCGLLLLSSAAMAETASFNNNWRFSKGEQSDSVTQANFDDRAWQEVRLPHDWAIAGPFDPNAHGFSGKLPWSGVGWYRKTFTLDAADQGKKIYLDFDGVMAFPEVYINGRLAGKWDYGYMSFRVDAADFIKFGEPNVIAVKADTRNQGTRWYPGAGIYRKVTLSLCDPVHVEHWSTYITTPEVSDTAATVNIQTTIENNRSTEETITINITLINPQGKTVTSAQQNMLIPADESRDFEQQLNIENPERWDIVNPALYTALVTVSSDDKVLDEDRTDFGVRTFQFTADDGFHLNGRRVQLYGVNLHHDQGPLGAVFNVRAMERQLEIMRAMGVNCIRTSHNPPAPELLELCDRMGLLVWDECFDKWDDKSARVNGQPPLEEYGEKQIRNFIMRDRNHPSIVVWSIGNEINNQPGDREGKSPERVAYMRDFVLKYDDTRPIGMACHVPYTATTHILDALDLTGWNYQRRYSDYREHYPDKPIIYSESASTVSSRGFYDPVLPPVKTDYSDGLQVSSYDLNATSWSDIPDIEFDRMEKDDYIAGEMVWTGFDYIGEPTPYDAQARSSYFGIVDLCGIPKDRYYLYRSQWLPNETTVHILPHWNWPDRVGQNVPVFIYTNGDNAELFLNGKSLGRRTKGEIPEKPTNWAQGKPVTCNTELANEGHNAAALVDADSDTFWCASSRST